MVDAQDLKGGFIENYRIYGPYTRKDGRQVVVIVDANNNKKTVSYPKFLVEKHLGRKLNPDETVHHKDGNFLNNDFSNLEILALAEHARLDALRVKPVRLICPICKKYFLLRKDQRKTRSKLQAGPFCSKRCTGYYGKMVQEGKEKLSRKEIKIIREKPSKFEPINGNINSGVGNIGESPAEKRGNTEGTHESENAVETRCPTT